MRSGTSAMILRGSTCTRLITGASPARTRRATRGASGCGHRRGRDAGSRSSRSASFTWRPPLDVRAKVLRVLECRFVAGPFGPKRASASSRTCLGISWSSRAAPWHARRLRVSPQLGGGLLHIGRLLGRGESACSRRTSPGRAPAPRAAGPGCTAASRDPAPPSPDRHECGHRD